MIGGSYYGSAYSGGTEGDESVVVPANAIQNLIDNFNDNSLDGAKWSDWGGANTNETNSELEILVDSTSYHGIQSVATDWDLTNSYFFIQVKDAGDQTTTEEAYPMELFDINGDSVLIAISGNNVIAQSRVGGINITAASILYDPLVHRWFKIREDSGTIYFDYSTDGHAWNNFASVVSSTILIDALYVFIYAGAYGTVTTPHTHKFDNVDSFSLEMAFTGTFLMSGSVDLTNEHHLAFTGHFLMGGSVDGAIEPILQTAATKVYEYKVYDSDFNFLGRWDDVISDLTFSQEINSGGSAIDVLLARNSDTLIRGFEVLTDDSGTPIVTDSLSELAMETVTTNPIGPGTTVDMNLNLKIFVFPEGDGLLPRNTWVEVRGGGQSGHSKTTLGGGGGGIGGSFAADFVPILPGQTYAITVGAQVTAPGSDNGATDGADSSFDGTVTAKGGNSATTNVGEVVFVGGAGGSGATSGGGGGEGAGSTAAGHAGTNSPGGASDAPGGTGGDGGDGGAGKGALGASAGDDGVAPGGGGGGSRRLSSGTHLGGKGARGQVDVYYDNRVFSFTSSQSWVAPPPLSGRLIFTGYISKYVSNYGQNENTKVTVFSYGADLDNYVLEDGSGNTRVPFLSQDPSAIIRSALDTFNADDGIPTYDQISIDNTLATVTYTFNVNTILEVIKKALELAPTDWFWYYDMANNLVNFHTRPLAADHTFVLGKHILDLNLEKYIEDLTNVVYFTGGPINPFVIDPFNDVAGTSISAHTGTTGASWTLHPASGATNNLMITDANRLRPNVTAEGVWMASGTSLSSDMTVAVDVFRKTWAGDFGVVGRVNATALTYYLGRITPSSNLAEIYKCVAGSFTLLASGAFADPGADTTVHMELKIEGAEISIIIDGNTIARATNTDIPTGNVAGIRGVTAQSNSTGLHFDNFNVSSQANQNVNFFKKYTNPSSVTDFRRGLQRPTDNRVKLEDSADIIAASLLDRADEPRFRSAVTISNRVYDIESIALGQLIAFRNFGNFIDGITMQIVRIDYTPDKVTLQLDTLLPSVPKRLEDIKRNLNQGDVVDNPDQPSV